MRVRLEPIGAQFRPKSAETRTSARAKTACSSGFPRDGVKLAYCFRIVEGWGAERRRWPAWHATGWKTVNPWTCAAWPAKGSCALA